MNKKALSLAVYIALSYPGISLGLGLGEIESASSLNQPFKAKINLLSVNGADIRNLNVKVASPSIFRRVGIDRPAYLNGLRFRSVMENGQPVIQVSSNQPVQEPFINFLLEVSWPKGQLLKEYTVLLDPPVLMQPGTSVASSNTAGVRAEPTRAVQQQQQRRAAAPATNNQNTTRAQLQRQRIIAEQRQRDANAQRRQQALQQQRQRAQALQARRGGAAPAAPVNDGLRRPSQPLSQQAAAPTRNNAPASRTYRVRKGDTLYKVAAKTGYQGVRTEQMMMALFEANPTAFRKRNINNLKAGVDLRRPSINEAQRIGLSQARQQIRSQSSEWKSQRSTQVASSNKAPVMRDNQAPQTRASGSQPNNKLVEVLGSTDNNNSANSGNLSGQSKVNNLNRQLTLASESLSARNRENDELQSRVSELESLLRKKNRLITLKNEQLAELQVSLGQPPSAMTDGTDVEIEDPIAATGEAIGDVMSNKGESGTIVRAQDPQQAIINDSQAPEVFETPVASEGIDDVLSPASPFVEEEEGGILDLISSPMVLALGAGSLAALLLGFLFLRRRNAKDEFDDYSPIDFDDPSLSPGAADFDGGTASSSTNSPVAASDDPFAGLGDDAQKIETQNSFNADPADELLDEPAIVAGSSKPAAAMADPEDLDDGDDILQEADVYIVYGLHEQAEVELKKAIEKEPNNLEYRAKLLENYNASDNKEGFEAAAAEYAQIEGAQQGPLWDKVSGWGRKLLPSSPLFAGPGVAAAIQDKASKAGSGLGSKLGMAAGAVAAGGIAVTAGKAIADTAKDKLGGAGDIVTDAADKLGGGDMLSGAADKLGAGDMLSGAADKLGGGDMLSGAADKLGVDVPSMDLPDLGGATDKVTESLDFDEMDLDSMLSSDVELPSSADLAKPEIIDKAAESADLDFDFSDFEIDDAKESVTGAAAGVEVPELVEGLDVDDFSDLDLDLGDSKDDLLGGLDTNDLDVANLNLALDGSKDGVGKILPESSVYKMSGGVKAESKDSVADLDDDLSFLNLGDDKGAVEGEVGTKLDLARAYIDMGDVDGARGTLEEVLMEGNDAQRKEAEELLHKAG